FLLFVNRAGLFSEQYRKYVTGELRRAFGYEGCPLVLVPKERTKTIEPVRSAKGKRRPKKSSEPRFSGGGGKHSGRGGKRSRPAKRGPKRHPEDARRLFPTGSMMGWE